MGMEEILSWPKYMCCQARALTLKRCSSTIRVTSVSLFSLRSLSSPRRRVVSSADSGFAGLFAVAAGGAAGAGVAAISACYVWIVCVDDRWAGAINLYVCSINPRLGNPPDKNISCDGACEREATLSVYTRGQLSTNTVTWYLLSSPANSHAFQHKYERVPAK